MANPQIKSTESTTKNKSTKSNTAKKTVPEKNQIFQYLQRNLVDKNNDQQRNIEKDDFYAKFLKSIVDLCGSDKNCHGIKESLKRKLEASKQKEAQIKESIAMCLEINVQKDKKIRLLENQAEKSHNSPATSNSDNVNTKKNAMQTPILFDQFNGILTENQLGTLRSIVKSTTGDSTFVLNCVRFMYCDDLGKLASKSVTGGSKKDSKEALSPQKLGQMKTMYVERLTDLNIGKEEKGEREKKFNQHVHRAIINTNATLKNKRENTKVINFAKQ